MRKRSCGRSEGPCAPQRLLLLDARERPSTTTCAATMQRWCDSSSRSTRRRLAALMPPEPSDDPTLDLDAHMRVVAVPPPGDERCSTLRSAAEQPLDRASPVVGVHAHRGPRVAAPRCCEGAPMAITDGGPLQCRSCRRLRAHAGPTGDAGAAADLDRPPARRSASRARQSAKRREQCRLCARRAGRRSTSSSTRRAAGRAGEAARFVASLQRQPSSPTVRSDVMTAAAAALLRGAAPLPPSMRASAAHLGGSLNDVYVTASRGARAVSRTAGSDLQSCGSPCL
jgi:hypothetical protein